MLIKITFQFILLIFITGILNAQDFESVEKEAERILISLSDGHSVNTADLNDLKHLLSSDFDNDVIGFTLHINQQSIDSLKNHLGVFESELKSISTDSAFVLFNDWYLHFQNVFYDYNKAKFFSSDKTKILLFSTSMSCYCTLKMSREQTIEIVNFVRSNNNDYDYWIVDSYWYNELQIEYESFFAPSVIVFDSHNKVIYKIEYEEKMLANLEDFFNN